MFTTSKDVMRLVAIGPILAVGALIAPMLTAEGTLVVLGEFQWLVRSMVFSSFVTYGLVTWLRNAGRASIANYWWATVTFCVEINQNVECTPSWLDRAARNRHRHAIEQAWHRWRGG